MNRFPSRRASRRDLNESYIVEALEHIGVVCYRLDTPCDLLTWARGKWLPMEIKMPKGILTPAQKLIQLITPIPVVYSVQDALALYGVAA